MLNGYERKLLIEFANRLATKYSSRGHVAVELSQWLERYEFWLLGDSDIEKHEVDHRQDDMLNILEHELELELADSDFPSDEFKMRKRKGRDAKVWKELRARIGHQAAKASNIKPDALARNISALATHMSLNKDEGRIFALVVRAARCRPLMSLCERLSHRSHLSAEEVVAGLTGIDPRRVSRALDPCAKLVASGLLECEDHPRDGFGLVLLDGLLKALEPPSRGVKDIFEKLFSPVEPAEVEWDDFEHLGSSRDFVFDLLSGAVQQRAKGINILLHGPPGTGKTEFCKVLAEKIGASLHSVGETDPDGDEPTRWDRLQALRLGQKLLGDQNNSILLFDEMEDFLPGNPMRQAGGFPKRPPGSKVHRNRMFESNPVPTLWTTNDINGCDAALRRRIIFTMEFRTPPEHVRAGIWRKLAKQHRVDLSQDFCLEMAQCFPNAPALAASAIRATRIANGGPEDVRLAATALSRAVCGKFVPAAAKNPVRFDPALANADQNLAFIVERFIAHGAVNSGGLCLSGPPGTGKSAFARHLAEQLEMPVLERRVSDLLDCHVGNTEKNIAQAFAEALDRQAFLIFDEADSLLRSREMAEKPWEVSQVNEMLTWMESHALPFACTTNLMDQLDKATMRRFCFKVKFLPLEIKQRIDCFKRFFRIDPPAGLGPLDLLTPGDFAVVAERIKMLGIKDPGAIMDELGKEQDAKPGASNRIGFQAAG